MTPKQRKLGSVHTWFQDLASVEYASHKFIDVCNTITTQKGSAAILTSVLTFKARFEPRWVYMTINMQLSAHLLTASGISDLITHSPGLRFSRKGTSQMPWTWDTDKPKSGFVTKSPRSCRSVVRVKPTMQLCTAQCIY